ncbi:MAG: DUF6421 family protein [Candidatus Nanopelagicales bacterium]
MDRTQDEAGLVVIPPSTELRQRTRVRVLIDEAHQEAWSARPEVTARMQPHHPADSSYARAAQLLADRDFEVVVNAEGLLTADRLAGVDVVVIAHPSDPQWEATTGVGSPSLTDDELAALRGFVEGGGGLVVLGETEEAKYGANLDALLAPYGIAFGNATVQDYEHHHKAPSWVLGGGTDAPEVADVLHRIDQVCFYRAGALTVGDGARAVVTASGTASPANAPLVAVAESGAGRVVAFADSDLFGDDCISEFDHQRLWLNTMYWVALPSFASSDPVAPSPVLAEPNWSSLLAAVSALRAMQAADGTVDLTVHDRETVAEHVASARAALAALAPHFPHDADFLAQQGLDLQAWLDSGCGVPDFGPSLELFRPESVRADGVEHLSVFPMYAPNGTTERVFELLLVRGPWPQWLSQIEQRGFPNDKFVPVHLLGHTAGYATECAVFFPETVTVSGKAPNYFGGIFCDREASRFHDVTGACVDVVRLQLPPDAQALIADEGLARDTFLLWDLIHDRAHSRGDLPFDPFMVRQRLPFWMYSLEELRCDLTSFVQAGEMKQDFPFARHVQYAVLLDRMLRFPVTGSRVRNYDGLGGQIMFGYLHQRGVVRWTDNTLVIDWEALPDAVADLLAEVQALYRRGIDSSRVRYWIDAHDFVSQYVQPALASAWSPEARAEGAPPEDEPKAWVDSVLDDEFPLNLFFRSLQGKMAPVFEERSAAFAAAREAAA